MTLVPLMVFILVIGIYPKLILNYITPTLDAMLLKMGGVLS